MRLSVSVVGNGRYWRAGEEIPDDILPPEYATAYGTTEPVVEETPAGAPPTHIKIGRTWQRIVEGDQVPPGEGWIRVGKAFVRVLAAGQQ
jgi:hypothetical protein